MILPKFMGPEPMRESKKNGQKKSFFKPLLSQQECRIFWVEDSTRLEELACKLRSEPRVAVDLEADSLYRYRERICLIQVSSSQGSALIDSLAVQDLSPLKPILEDPSLEKVFHGADYDVRLLKGAGFNPRGIFDTKLAAECLGIKRLGLSDLLEERLGIRLEKRFQRADWSKRPLPGPMVEYAVGDTCHLLALRDSLARELEALGRMDWARAHFLELETIEPLCREPPSAFKTRGARDLDGQGLRVLQALLEWREEQARRRDVPVFKILQTDTLVSLAREKPLDSKAMLGIPGITKKVLEIWGESLFKLIQEALEKAPLPSWNTAKSPQNPPGSRKRFLALKQVRDQMAEQEGLHPGVLCPNSLLRTLAVSKPQDFQSKMKQLLKPWQLKLLGERFLEAFSGACRTRSG